MESVKNMAPFVAMTMLEIGEVGMTTLSKKAMSSGLSNFVFVAYYESLGVLLITLYFIFHYCRNKMLPLTLPLLCKFFVLGLLGISVAQMSGFTGIKYGSPTLASALRSLVPGITFFLAVICRMEKVALKSKTGQAKIIGTLVSIGGALMVTLYKGPPIALSSSSPPQITLSSLLSISQESNWAFGGFLLLVATLSIATWHIYQKAVIMEYPQKVTIVYFSGLFGTLQCVVVSLLVERDPNAWKLHPGIDITAILYSGIFGGIFRNFILTWCIHKKGPFFVALFKPLGTAIAVIMGVLFLGEIPHVGSLLGAAVITIGFYTVMWGKANEQGTVLERVRSSASESSPQRARLLPDA